MRSALRSVMIRSARIRTDTTVDQDCVLMATVQVCTACMIVSLLTTCLNLNIPCWHKNDYRLNSEE